MGGTWQDDRDAHGRFTRRELRNEARALREANHGRASESPWWLPEGTHVTPRGEKVIAVLLVIAFLFFLALAGGVEL